MLSDIFAVVKERLAMVHNLELHRLRTSFTIQEEQELSGVRGDDEGMPLEPKIHPRWTEEVKRVVGHSDASKPQEMLAQIGPQLRLRKRAES